METFKELRRNTDKKDIKQIKDLIPTKCLGCSKRQLLSPLFKKVLDILKKICYVMDNKRKRKGDDKEKTT